MAIEEIAQLVTGLTTANLKHDQAELINKLADLKVERAEFILKIQNLEEQIRALEEEKENPLVYNDEDGLFYSADDTDNKHPFCPACYDTDKKRIHLPRSLKCPRCKANYYQWKPSDIRSGHPLDSSTMFKGY
jgi:hypothetical protein